ncbi:helix-turn-helix transcriptional regulator [Collinsella tanakaei]|uniref:helix-turn-helix transcriptional regulator n=1 Tax=Collinsella tanakaei TaxID=626935 RepID=UPI0019597270|nr:helix-turn-helix transcriptional regulator [Collinsella tanakaei]MBM6868549.1 helix-turn-helix transcriptional regulator [Collinsella tanakaei]
MISDKLLALRKRSGMSQQEVASAIGVTRQTVGNWGLGQGSPALDKAAELARLYGVTLDDLANDEVDVVTFGKGGGVWELAARDEALPLLSPPLHSMR